MLFTPAYAQTAGGSAGAMSGLAGIIPFILMFVIFYFLLIRPQQKRVKEHKQMVENLRRGDQVVTAGGIHGKVTKVGQEDEAELQISDGVRIRVVKSTIASVVSKTEPAANDGWTARAASRGARQCSTWRHGRRGLHSPSA